MTVPYLDETREQYVDRMKENQLWIAKRKCELGLEHGMWVHLLTWAQCEEIYGEHWDKVEIIKNDQPI